ncbi:MAG: MAPEG family protein [Woeseiaceae bacterium]|nr:MAPEG family protein [Woeseiaceae bacterium]
MDRSTILLPFFGVMLLTLVVWLVMYIRRIRFLILNRVDLRTVDTPDKAASVVPYEVGLAAHNLKNLFELPVLFYAVCLYLFVSDSVDATHLAAAWWFFAFRVAHSVIHCSSNVVIHRFTAYLLSALALWLMVIRAFLRLLGQE